MKETVVAVSGYFDPLHIGHLDYLEEAKKLGTTLIVIVNTDEQASRHRGFVFMKLEDRMRFLMSLNCVDEVIPSIDTDGSVCDTLRTLKPDIFAKGADWNMYNIPERDICDELGIRIVFKIGGRNLISSKYLVNKLRKVCEY